MALQRKNSSLEPAPAPVLDPKVAAYCRDLQDWPRSWMGFEEDVAHGEQIVSYLLPFLQHLAGSSHSPKTIRRHVDSLWLLGGEIIRDLHDGPRLRKLSAGELVRNAIDSSGGPLIYNGSEQDQRSLDATCRRLYRFLNQSTAA